MKVEILSPGASLFIGEASMVTLPGASGSFSVLDQHAPLISTLTQGEIVIDSGKMSIPILRGVIEVSENKVSILVQN
jgi:F-type H+-transporting ATPase subunit epsilon